jgi:hypothetical protein
VNKTISGKRFRSKKFENHSVQQYYEPFNSNYQNNIFCFINVLANLTSKTFTPPGLAIRHNTDNISNAHCCVTLLAPMSAAASTLADNLLYEVDSRSLAMDFA